jgi:ferredoxin-NADP reductase/MOSC domain-containing protein YiiM
VDSILTGPDALPTLLSVNVGLPAEHEWSGGTIRTAIWKSPKAGPQRVNRLNIVGDDQADKLGHGGEHRAVMVYQLESYDFWQRHFDRDDFEYGQFGENFTVTGLADDEVCIGDRYRIGSAIFEVTQPRVTCFRVGIRLGVPTMAALLVEHKRPGFYLRVIEEGYVTAGDPIERISRPADTLTVARTDGLLYLPGRTEEELRTAVEIPALSAGWRSSFQDLIDQAMAADDNPGWSGFLPLRVVELHTETDDILSVVLAAPDSVPKLPTAKAGQYLTVRVPSGEHGAAGVRNYSLSSAPGAEHYRISVKREDLGQVSRWLHANLAACDQLDTAVPRGDFVLAPGTAPVVLVSAGIGITPMLAMLHDLTARGSTRPVVWIHVTRSAASRPFAQETLALIRQLPNGRAHTFYTGAGPLPQAAGESLYRGRPTGEALRVLAVRADADAYVCGPSAFMAAMTTALREVGLGPDQIHSEAFGASAAPANGSSVPPHTPPGPPGDGPTITYAHSGLTVPFSEKYDNLLELTEACDVPVHWSCRTGVCQSCRTPLVAGSVAYDPQPLDPPGDTEVLLCCARPADALVLDL